MTEAGRPTVLLDDPSDRALLREVRPEDWEAPEPKGRYNLVVVGAGTAGLVSAAIAAGLGARVALVERNMMGGDCLNVGCVPSKALLRSARAAADVRAAHEFGVRVPEGVTVDFPAVTARMRAIRAGLAPTDSASRFRSLGVDVFLGQGRFVGPDALEVAGKTLRFARAAVCTGARAAVPDVPGLVDSGYLTNETIFALTELPPRLAVIGAGPVGCELAQAFARFGSRVTLYQRSAEILPREDVDASEIVRNRLARDGVNVITRAWVKRAERRGGVTALWHSVGDGPDGTSEFDAVLVAAGRAPNVEGLGLEAAGVAFGERGVTVDDRLRTSNSRIYAAGDVASRFQFTHAADALARVLVRNALFLGRSKASALTIPWCTYTDPEVAGVGLTGPEAEEGGLDVQTFLQPLTHVDRAVLDGEAEGFARVLVKRGTDRILGATAVGRNAGDWISEASLAMTNGLGLKAIGATIHPYPTQAEVWKKLADAHARTRLTPTAKRLLGTWLRWSR